MNYIYDILLNFNEKYYDFYEWDENIVHIKKIPIIKISNKQLKIIFENKVKIDLNIKNKTEVFNNKSINSCIVFSDEFGFAIKFDKDGSVIERSSLLFEDLEDVLDDKIENKILNIEVIEPIKNNFLIKEDDILYNYIIKEINKLINNKDYNALSYIYYECFNTKESDLKKVIKRIKNITLNDFYNYGEKIYGILKLTTNK